MRSFEYKRLGFSAVHRQIVEDGEAIKVPRDLDTTFWKRVAELGSDGWDLVAGFGEVLVFKREIQAGQAPVASARAAYV